jgi:hypothetical protein
MLRSRNALLGGTLAALLSLSAASPIFADTFTIAPGIRRCVTAPVYANGYERVDGRASPGVKFQVYRNGDRVDESPSDFATAYAQESSILNGNFLGPGWYYACVRNKGTGDAVVTLTVDAF